MSLDASYNRGIQICDNADFDDITGQCRAEGSSGAEENLNVQCNPLKNTCWSCDYFDTGIGVFDVEHQECSGDTGVSQDTAAISAIVQAFEEFSDDGDTSNSRRGIARLIPTFGPTGYLQVDNRAVFVFVV